MGAWPTNDRLTMTYGAPGRSPPRWPVMSRPGTRRRCPCTSSPPSWPPSARPAGAVRRPGGRQAEINRFLGVITGAVPIADYFTPRNLVRLLGVRGMATVMLSSCASRGRRQRRARQWQGPEARSRLCSPSRAHESTPAGWCSQRGPAPASRQVCSKAVTIPTKRSGAVLFGACLDRYEPALATAWAPASAIGSRVSPHKGVTG